MVTERFDCNYGSGCSTNGTDRIDAVAESLRRTERSLSFRITDPRFHPTDPTTLQNVGESAFQVPEEKPSEDEYRGRVCGQNGKLLPGRPDRGEHAVSVRTHHPGKRIGLDQRVKTVRDLLFADHDRSDPEPQRHNDGDHLRGIPQIDVEAGGDPCDADG